MIPRIEVKHIEDSLNTVKKIHIIYGPRQAGKTTVLKSIADKLMSAYQKPIFLNCDLKEHNSVINTTSITELTKLLKGNTHVLIDEAQRLDNPGLTLKIIYDQFPNI
ncbi:MAG: AAA family ATPase, partial [bacterium]|nr:AAA family ATPase [bacterium]